VQSAVSGGLQYTVPIIRALNVALAKRGSFDITIRVKAEQGVVARAFKVLVAGGALLIPIDWVDGAVHIQHDLVQRFSSLSLIH
jgi:hypothetical protein